MNGNHWLFVDRAGTILEVSNNTRVRGLPTPHPESVFQPTRRQRGRQTTARADGPIDFALFHGVARDPSICLKSSISGMTVEIDPDHPELLTCAWVSLPVHAGSFPLLMGQAKTPEWLLSGKAYLLGKRTKGERQSWENLERTAHGSKEQLKERVLASVANDSGDLRSVVPAGSETRSGRRSGGVRDPRQRDGAGRAADMLERWSQEQSGMLVYRLQALESASAAK